MILVETTIWVDLFRQTENDHTRWLARNLADPSLSLTDLALCEVLQGATSDRTYTELRDLLLSFEVQAIGGTALALQSADHHRFLRRKGITVRKTVDCLIATFCILERHDLLHRDRDYDSFEKYLGLRVIHP